MGYSLELPRHYEILQARGHRAGHEGALQNARRPRWFGPVEVGERDKPIIDAVAAIAADRRTVQAQEAHTPSQCVRLIAVSDSAVGEPLLVLLEYRATGVVLIGERMDHADKATVA